MRDPATAGRFPNSPAHAGSRHRGALSDFRIPNSPAHAGSRHRGAK